MRKLEPISALILAILILADGMIWFRIMQKPETGERLQFLDVGQGDSQLLTLDTVHILTDAGPDRAVLTELQSSLGSSKRYIDIGIITHPEKDHYGGFRALLDRYDFGAILWSGYAGVSSTEWTALRSKIEEKKIPLVVVGAGDIIRYGSSTSEILSPNNVILSGGETNDTGIVQRIHTSSFSALLTADIGFSVESYLLEHADLAADILKIGHHGSRFSSSDVFLAAVQPSISVIQVGRGNTYGHPADETLLRIQSSTTSRVFRTDQDGTVTILPAQGGLEVRRGK